MIEFKEFIELYKSIFDQIEEKHRRSIEKAAYYEHGFRGKDLKYFTTKRAWEIIGEDPNPDAFGSHSLPTLEYVEGTFIEAAKYAVTLKGFYTWGGGGKIRPYNSPKIKIKKL